MILFHTENDPQNMILADDGAISVTYGHLSSALIQYYPTQEMVRSLHIHRVIDK